MVSTCPRCQKPVSIPPRVDSSAEVRCPLCEAEYVLSESLALAPPELIPLNPVPERTQSDASERVELINHTGDAAVAVVEHYPTAPASNGLRRKKQKSGLQMLIEVIAGGLAGCLVAYYALAFYFGPEFKRVGLPPLPLPFISWITTPPDQADEGESKPSARHFSGPESSVKFAILGRESAIPLFSGPIALKTCFETENSYLAPGEYTRGNADSGANLHGRVFTAG